MAYCFGAFTTHALVLAMHEISHNLAFPTQLPNRVLGIYANLATFFPHFSMFQRYHMEHHQYQGVDGIDTDVPTQFEVEFFNNSAKKVLWLLLQPFFYALRPLMVKPKNPNKWELINWVVILSFDLAVFYYLGGKSLAYLIAGTFLGLGLHPVAGHFVAEHYEFIRGQETYSYYGPLNMVNFNVGFHYEHHDFPKIAWSNLPKVRQIAPEFYDPLPSYTSYTSVFWKYITDPTVGPFSRVKRKPSPKVKADS
jgi:sphingolipid delta-4 desaturase